jgi:hypothetical protein
MSRQKFLLLFKKRSPPGRGAAWGGKRLAKAAGAKNQGCIRDTAASGKLNRHYK